MKDKSGSRKRRIGTEESGLQGAVRKEEKRSSGETEEKAEKPEDRRTGIEVS